MMVCSIPIQGGNDTSLFAEVQYDCSKLPSRKRCPRLVVFLYLKNEEEVSECECLDSLVGVIINYYYELWHKGLLKELFCRMDMTSCVQKSFLEDGRETDLCDVSCALCLPFIALFNLKF